MVSQRLGRAFILLLGIGVFAAVPALYAEEALELVQNELQRLTQRVPRFKPVVLQPMGVSLSLEQSLTIEDLRGVQLDENPPMLGPLDHPYKASMTDTFAPGEAPYIAQGIAPFRLKYFNCEFNYGGWHNYAMADYASTRGFSIVYPYVRTISEGNHLPAGTQWLNWGGFINWRPWFKEHDLPDGRYDLLMDMDLEALHEKAGIFARKQPPEKLKEAADMLMIDMEHPVLPQEKLRQAEWYPKKGPDAEKAVFEARYYGGYARTYTSAVDTARKAGWNPISIYGWQPYGRTWGGLEKPEVDPGTDDAWNAFGRRIYESVDIVHNSVYCFYWSPQNVAYTLANIDSNMAIIRSMPVRKPLRPYYWTLLHGGGGGWRWWRGQPLPNEEERAMIAMAFFTGIDGFDTWNWSGTGNHNAPPSLVAEGKKQKDYFGSGADVMLGTGFSLKPIDDKAAPLHTFRRYDVLHVLEVDAGDDPNVRFQKIQHNEKNRGITDDQPVYSMPVRELVPRLRLKTEPVAAMIEGMALIKPLEYTLSHGEVKIDVPAREQFRSTLPIVRRVKLGPYHVLITYDPQIVYGGDSGEIVLSDFDGKPGCTVTLPADERTRIFVLAEDAPGR